MTPDSNVFEEPDERAENWVDIRMTEPEKGEWDVDVVVVDGAVEYLDLRVRPELLASFIDCLVEDVPESRARDVLSTVAERHGIEGVPEDSDVATSASPSADEE